MVTSKEEAELDYLGVLSYLWGSHQGFVKKEKRFSLTKIFSELGFKIGAGEDSNHENYLAISQASKALGGNSRPEKILAALKVESNREKLCAGLELDGLFDCKTGSQVDRLIESSTTVRPIPAPVVLNKDTSNIELVEVDNKSRLESILSDGERRARKLLAKIVCAGVKAVRHWEMEPWSGATVVIRSVANSQDVKDHYKYLFFVRPSSLDNAYDIEIRALAKHLGVETSLASLPAELLEALKSSEILLVLCDANYLPLDGQPYAKKSLVRKLIATANEKHRYGGLTRIITVGIYKDANLDDEMNELREAVKVSSLKRFDFYSQLFDFYRKERGYDRAEEGGSRLKRGKWHYEYLNKFDDQIVWPGMVRLRAYFASNISNRAYFDPTLGFDGLTGSKDLPLSIRISRDDLQAYLVSSYIKSGKARSLRFNSTCKHWLTDSLLEVLRLSFSPREGKPTSRLDRNVFLKQIGENSPITIHYNDKKSDTESQYFRVDLGLKAIVQDEWKSSDPFERAVSHWKLAKYLWDNQDDKQFLHEEFPYSPHWGRSRIFLLGECIRHLICTIECVVDLQNHHLQHEYDSFPNPPTREIWGCSPHEVINFCFVTIYQKELNGNFSSGLNMSSGRASRALSKRHGAFEYAVELLQLMGHNRIIGDPHRYLDPQVINLYLRECAYALLDFGELDQAKAILVELVESICKSSSDELSRSMLDLSLVLTELSQYSEAEKLVDEVESIYKPKGQLQKRVLSRRFSIAYCKGDNDVALQISESIIGSVGDIRVLGPEFIQTWIDLVSNEDPHSDIALKECLGALFRSSAAGLQHESLAYRILLSRIYRLREENAVAEQVLDDVLRDVLKYGCSERTYLELYLEAGMVLSSVGQYVRAYTSYLRPCMLRAEGRKYRRFNQLAKDQAIVVLENIRLNHENLSDGEWQDLINSAVKQEEIHIRRETSTRNTAEIDPLFSFYVPSSIRLIKKLGKVDFIDAQLEFVSQH